MTTKSAYFCQSSSSSFEKGQTSIIHLPCSLKWNEIEKYAHKLVLKGGKIIWNFDFPISPLGIDQIMIRSWEFTLDYFKSHLYPQFEKESRGVILYKGKWDFSYTEESLSWQERLFNRNEGFHILKELACFLPETLSLYLLFDLVERELPLLAELCFDHFIIASNVRRYKYALPMWQWGDNFLEQQETICYKKGILLPPLISVREDLLFTIENILKKDNEYRLIPESVLTQEWQGLESLIIFSSYLTSLGKRKIMGFTATGGEIIQYPC